MNKDVILTPQKQHRLLEILDILFEGQYSSWHREEEGAELYTDMLDILEAMGLVSDSAVTWTEEDGYTFTPL